MGLHEAQRNARPSAQHEHINMLCRALRPGVLGSRKHIAVGRVRGNHGRCARIHARIGAAAHIFPARETSCGAALHALPLPRSRPQSTLLAGSYREGSATGGALRPQARTHTCTKHVTYRSLDLNTSCLESLRAATHTSQNFRIFGRLVCRRSFTPVRPTRLITYRSLDLNTSCLESVRAATHTFQIC